MGLLITITQGFSNLDKINIGIIVLFLSVALFTLLHSLTKIRLDKNELFPTQIVFVRNLLSGIILVSIYFLVFQFNSLYIVFSPANFIFILLMGLDYGFSLFFWYKTLNYIKIGTATIINSLTPFATGFFSFIILGDPFTIFHFIGTVIIIFSIIMIVREESK